MKSLFHSYSRTKQRTLKMCRNAKCTENRSQKYYGQSSGWVSIILMNFMWRTISILIAILCVSPVIWPTTPIVFSYKRNMNWAIRYTCTFHTNITISHRHTGSTSLCTKYAMVSFSNIYAMHNTAMKRSTVWNRSCLNHTMLMHRISIDGAQPNK